MLLRKGVVSERLLHRRLDELGALVSRRARRFLISSDGVLACRADVLARMETIAVLVQDLSYFGFGLYRTDSFNIVLSKNFYDSFGQLPDKIIFRYSLADDFDRATLLAMVGAHHHQICE